MRILVVDDDLSIARGLSRLLRFAEHQVEVAGNGDEALVMARASNPDLVVSDVDMPGRDGLALFDALRREAPETDFILMTGSASVQSAVGAMRKGATDYLLKPFLNEELIARVTTIAERRSLRSELKSAREALSGRLGPYVLGAKISAGGMGVVCEASHAKLRRPPPVSLLRTELMSAQALARFEREVQLTCRLTHPNTISVYDYGRTADGIFYYAMELLGGASVAEVVSHTGKMSIARTVHVLKGACGSLVEAHDKGLVHRDVKPNNIQLCERGGIYDVPKVLDFGLVEDVHNPEDPGKQVVGTPGYLAPETIKDPSAITPLVDVYGIGALAYFMLSGRPAYSGPMTLRLQQQELPAPLKLRDKALEALIMACLAREPKQRPKSMRHVLQAITALPVAKPWTERDAFRFWARHEAPIAHERRKALDTHHSRTKPS